MRQAPRPADHHEPWVARPCSSGSLDPFPQGIPDDADFATATQNRDRALTQETKRLYVIWGSRMHEPGEAASYLSGSRQTFDDAGVVASDLPRPVALRVCECVNAMRGVASPEALVKDLRALLLALSRQDIPGDDVRVVRMLALLGKGQGDDGDQDHAASH